MPSHSKVQQNESIAQIARQHSTSPQPGFEGGCGSVQLSAAGAQFGCVAAAQSNGSRFARPAQLTSHDAVQQKVHYETAGFAMLHDFATWPEGGNSVESGLYLLADLFRKGKLKIFKGLSNVLGEFRMYHRDEKGRIVKINDDLLDAIRYAYMMRRFAIRRGDIGKTARAPIKFSGWN